MHLLQREKANLRTAARKRASCEMQEDLKAERPQQKLLSRERKVTFPI